MKVLILSALLCLAIAQVCYANPIKNKAATNEVEAYDENAELCLEKTGYSCKTDDDCAGLSKGSCETVCDSLMGVCYFKTSYDTLHYKK